MYKLRRMVESLTDSLTMYVTVVLALIAIVIASLALSLIGELGYAPLSLLGTLAVVLSSSFLLDRLFAWTFSTTPNRESGLITALILYLTVAPAGTALEYLQLALVAGIAVASKYLIVWRGRHIFNPAAAALAVGSLTGLTSAFWWVGTPLFLPVVILAGLVVITKTRRYRVAGAFVATALLTSALAALLTGYPVVDALRLDLVSGPLLFFAAIMLTEPLTSPSTKRLQVIYALLVGVLFSAQIPWLSTPQMALLLGNLFAFACILRTIQPSLKVEHVKKLTSDLYEVSLVSKRPVQFTPGQYAELSLPHHRQDSRGTRRIFSFASRPGDSHIRFVTRIPQRASSYKQSLRSLSPGKTVRITYIGGDFVLSRDTTQSLVWIAGGVGITPFLSMLDALVTSGETRRITLLYLVRSPDEILATDLLDKAGNLDGVTIIPLSTGAKQPTSTAKQITEYIAGLSSYDAYISGSPGMVDTTRALLVSAENRPQRIITDYFSGY